VIVGSRIGVRVRRPVAPRGGVAIEAVLKAASEFLSAIAAANAALAHPPCFVI